MAGKGAGGGVPPGAGGRVPPGPGEAIRLDKWLWQARLYKSRSLANAAVTEGRVRIDGMVVTRPAHPLRPGATLTLALGGRVRLLRVLAPGLRRGPAIEARMLYDDLDAPRSGSGAEADSGAGVESGPPALE